MSDKILDQIKRITTASDPLDLVDELCDTYSKDDIMGLVGLIAWSIREDYTYPETRIGVLEALLLKVNPDLAKVLMDNQEEIYDDGRYMRDDWTRLGGPYGCDTDKLPVALAVFGMGLYSTWR
jgi:hypothetical protein